MTLKWYGYYQSHTGAKFIVDDAVDKYVLIQARGVTEANQFAEEIGIYFDGVKIGWDCSCCGDRWHRHYDTDAGSDVPYIFGEPIKIFKNDADQKRDGIKNNYRMYPYSFFQNKN
jgi:hypothetical protein